VSLPGDSPPSFVRTKKCGGIPRSRNSPGFISVSRGSFATYDWSLTNLSLIDSHLFASLVIRYSPSSSRPIVPLGLETQHSICGNLSQDDCRLGSSRPEISAPLPGPAILNLGHLFRSSDSVTTRMHSFSLTSLTFYLKESREYSGISLPFEGRWYSRLAGRPQEIAIPLN